MDSIDLNKISKTDDLDHNFILNVPEEIGIKILEAIKQENNNIDNFNSVNNNLLIDIIQSINNKLNLDESRKLVFKVNDKLYPGTILDYPCIIEAQKTMDNKTYFKAGDISQMLFIHDKNLSEAESIKDFNPFLSNDKVFNNMIWLHDHDHKYKLKDGLTKGAFDVRKKRFKAKQIYDKKELNIVAKKIKDIIDNGAAKYEKNLNKNKTLNNNDDLNSCINQENNKSEYTFDNICANKGKEDKYNNCSNIKNSEKSNINLLNNKRKNSNSNNSSYFSNKKPPKIRIIKNNRINNTTNKRSSIVTKNNDDTLNLSLNETANNEVNNNNDIYNSNIKINNNTNNNITHDKKNTVVINNVNDNKAITDLKDKLYEEYTEKKSEYDSLKIIIENNPDNVEAIKKRKKLKKHLKALKKEITEGDNNNNNFENDSN